MKIAIIGAGQGGLRAAKVFADSGYDVTVYEKSPRNALGYDQIDTVEVKVFTDLGIPVPQKSYKGACGSFVPPFSDKKLLIWVDEDVRDWCVDRRTFSEELVCAAEKSGAEFKFETPVESLICDCDGIKGIRVNGEEVSADLVIDSAGVHSDFRRSLGGKFGITAEPEKEEVFNVYHGYYEPAFDVKPGDLTYNYYLKYQGTKGICWCGIEEDGSVSILVGRIGPLSKSDFEQSLTQLKMDNPVLSDKFIRGGHFAPIPVRYPLSKMVCNGYAVVGDAAFMTIPLLGNGVANAIRAGQMLAETVIENNSADINTLWKYQVRYMKEIGAGCCLVDSVKRGLLETENSDLTYLFESEAVTDDDVAEILRGKIPSHSPSEWASKFRSLAKVYPFLGTMISYALNGVKLMIKAMNIPEEYDSEKVYKWQYEYDKIFK